MSTSIEWAANAVTRFWRHVHKTPTCWIWTASTTGSGYGQFRVGDRKVKAHRFSWLLAGGMIPDGSILCHTCDNKICVNPAHLVLGDHGDNARDRQLKGRGASGPDPRKGRPCEHNPATKLNWEAVNRIRYLRRQGRSVREIAATIGISQSQVRNIAAGRNWKDVSNAD